MFPQSNLTTKTIFHENDDNRISTIVYAVNCYPNNTEIFKTFISQIFSIASEPTNFDNPILYHIVWFNTQLPYYTNNRFYKSINFLWSHYYSYLQHSFQYHTLWINSKTCYKYYCVQSIKRIILIDTNWKWFVVTTKSKKIKIHIVLGNLILNSSENSLDYSSRPWHS